MKMEDIDNQKFNYHIREIDYIKAMGREVSLEPGANRDLYPAGWFLISDYAKKIKILAEAIEKKCLISETSGYLDIVEGVEIEEDEEER